MKCLPPPAQYSLYRECGGGAAPTPAPGAGTGKHAAKSNAKTACAVQSAPGMRSSAFDLALCPLPTTPTTPPQPHTWTRASRDHTVREPSPSVTLFRLLPRDHLVTTAHPPRDLPVPPRCPPPPRDHLVTTS
eukprot:1262764-Rhodomonas_salina.1